ncbi:DNA polymerase III subunit gamma/tau [Emergencia sp.]|uniref:DNA polymerase III subunit gamma/tau n=1 Tax=Emergencia sp. TaxID=1926557 RepID=UPI003AEFCE68
MYTALYRAQRPEIFSEVIGQDHIVRILKNQIATDSVSHAYLFCGTRGTGKTTTARILAKAVNCLDDEDRPCGHCANCVAIKEGTFMDVVEIDAASNNGVDNIRELRESVKYPPAVGRKKVYIIDEVHMLSTGAFNALLKTLEEPPENVMFILATTDPQKLPQTILSRCMRLDFKRVPEKVLIDHMSRICSEKGVQVTDSALRLLAANADGSVRDGLSILDQCLAGGEKDLDRDTVLDFLGTVSEEFFLDLTDRVALSDVAGALVLLDEALQEGKDVKQLMKDWMSHYRSLLITKYIKNAEDMLNMSTENIEKLRNQSNQVSLDEINHGIITLSRTINDARYSTQPRILLELAIVTIASGLSAETQQAAPRMAQAQPRQQMAARPKKPAVSAKPAEPAGQAASTGVSPAQAENDDFDGSGYDLAEIWGRIFEEGEGFKGSFNLIRTGATLADMNGQEFKVIAHNEFTKQYVEANQLHICDLMEKIIGRRLKLVCQTENQKEDVTPDQEALELAEEVSAKLGLDVKIE